MAERTCGRRVFLTRLLSVAGAGRLRAQAPDAQVVLERLRAYLDSYEPKLSALVADEAFVQDIRYREREVNADALPGSRARRRLESDIGFLRLPGDDAWLAQRSVRLVDGVAPRPAVERLDAVLARAGSDAARHASAIAIENARHNLGHPRTNNVPTLPLELLGRRHSASFSTRGMRQERERGRQAWRLVVGERPPGRVVAYDDTRFNRSDVVVWTALDDGAILRADVVMFPPSGPGRHTIRVDFAPDAELGLLVPVRLEESFTGAVRGHGIATYSNYRRFETSGRVVPPV